MLFNVNPNTGLRVDLNQCHRSEGIDKIHTYVIGHPRGHTLFPNININIQPLNPRVRDSKDSIRMTRRVDPSVLIAESMLSLSDCVRGPRHRPG